MNDWKKNTEWKPKKPRRQAAWKHPHNQELVLGQQINLGTVQAWHIDSISLNKFTKLNLKEKSYNIEKMNHSKKMEIQNKI